VDKAARISEIYEEYAANPQLQAVARGRPAVRGHGPLDAPVVVVGEAPGEQEEREGRPFVGPSGKLLQELLRRAGIPWDYCYVTNSLSWRPEGNREPYPFEVMEGWDRLAAEIETVGPRVVIAAGSSAWLGVARNRLGRFAECRYRLIPAGDANLSYHLLGIHHPSWVLRQGRRQEEAEDTVIRALKMIFAGHD
jgi:DNA polymerase